LEILDNVSTKLKASHENVIKLIGDLINDNANKEKELKKLKNEKIVYLKKDLYKKIEDIKGVKAVAAKVDLDAQGMKDLAFQMKNEENELYMLLGSKENNKAILTLMISESLVEDKELHAGNIIKELSKEIEGGGGGQAFFATAGGKNVEGLDKALSKGLDLLKS
ncbi:MAG: DHHA1 domain-containing protein, partial [Flavobacteriales bacterium]